MHLVERNEIYGVGAPRHTPLGLQAIRLQIMHVGVVHP